MSTSASAAGTVEAVADRGARGRLLGRPGRARELLGLLDAEEPEQIIEPMAETLHPGVWPLPKNWKPRAKATACPHTDRWAHALGRCHSCASADWMRRHPKAARVLVLRAKQGEQARKRLRRREALGLPERASTYEVRAAAWEAAWSRLSRRERAERRAAIRARGEEYRRMKAQAIRRARAAEPTRLSNYRTLRLDLGERVDTTYAED